jgi:putative polyhydroxyalkanoate system protein
MATIEISRQHSLERELARKRAEELARSMEEKLGIRWRWDGEQIRFDAPSGAAKGTTGQVRVEATSIHVEIDLPLLLRAMKGMVESKVNQKLDAALAKG